VLPDVFNISAPVKPCTLCERTIKAAYEVDESCKFDKISKKWLVQSSEFDPLRNLNEKHRAKYNKYLTRKITKYDLTIYSITASQTVPKAGGISSVYYTIRTATSEEKLFQSDLWRGTLSGSDNTNANGVLMSWETEQNLLQLSFSENLIITIWKQSAIRKPYFLGSVQLNPTVLFVLQSETEGPVNLTFATLNKVREGKTHNIGGYLTISYLMAQSSENVEGEVRKVGEEFVFGRETDIDAKISTGSVNPLTGSIGTKSRPPRPATPVPLDKPTRNSAALLPSSLASSSNSIDSKST